MGVGQHYNDSLAPEIGINSKFSGVEAFYKSI
jgi:hypothetical protein